ncbi:MAG: hypothetical protein V3U09_02445 [Thermoplasmata archaeon]
MPEPKKLTFVTPGRVKTFIKSWRPRGCRSEIAYRNSLYKHLEKHFKKPPVKEYGTGRSRVDIAFDNRIAIEMKYKLTTTGKRQRLVGQLVDELKGKFGTVFVVVCGEVDKQILAELKKKYRWAIFIKK